MEWHFTEESIFGVFAESIEWGLGGVVLHNWDTRSHFFNASAAEAELLQLAINHSLAVALAHLLELESSVCTGGVLE